jgi:hypothetical protein
VVQCWLDACMYMFLGLCIGVVFMNGYNTIQVNFNLIHLIKWVKLLNFNSSILFWVRVEFISHVKNCQA